MGLLQMNILGSTGKETELALMLHPSLGLQFTRPGGALLCNVTWVDSLALDLDVNMQIHAYTKSNLDVGERPRYLAGRWSRPAEHSSLVVSRITTISLI